MQQGMRCKCDAYKIFKPSSSVKDTLRNEESQFECDDKLAIIKGSYFYHQVKCVIVVCAIQLWQYSVQFD